MGLSIKKDIATSLTSLIFVVVLFGGLMVTFPLLELSIKKVFFLFGVVFIISTILNFTSRENYIQRGVFYAALLIAFGFILNTPNRSISMEKIASPIEKNTIDNSFIILGNNIALLKNIKQEESKKSYSFKPIG